MPGKIIPAWKAGRIQAITGHGGNVLTNDLWGDIGELSENETLQVLTSLFAVYEKVLEQDLDNREALVFFSNLDNVVRLIRECNSNRR